MGMTTPCGEAQGTQTPEATDSRPFGKAMVDTLRHVKKTFEGMSSAPDSSGNYKSIDKSVREEVIGELDRSIEKHDRAHKPFPGQS